MWVLQPIRVYSTKKRPRPPQFESATAAIIARVHPRYTMTSPERIASLVEAVRYVERAGISGAIVECGVWRGGSSMAIALALVEAGSRDRDLYLFDTFGGMTEPEAVDRTSDDRSAVEKMRARGHKHMADWCYASIEDVRSNMESTQYPASRIHYVRGSVEETLPRSTIKQIALLRLDTDWYASTAAEMEYLFPLVAPGGVIILDDYGTWQGSRRAVDEYLAKHQIHLLLHRIDDAGRIAVVQGHQTFKA